MKKLLTAMLIVSFLFSGCGGEKASDNPAPKTEQTAPVKTEPSTAGQTTPVVENIPVEWSNVPERICTLPSIGSTRADFDNTYTPTAWNSVGHIRYNNDVFHAKFFDGTGNETADKRARAYMIIIQPLSGEELPDFVPKDLFPNDATNLQYNENGSDAVVKLKNFFGTSETLAKIFPHSGGNFGGIFNFDAVTNKFLGGTVQVMER